MSFARRALLTALCLLTLQRASLSGEEQTRAANAPAPAESAPTDAAEAIDGPPAPEPPSVINRDERGNATIRTMPLPSPLVIDGALDEAPYRDVPAMSDFIQQEPAEGRPASDKTEIWVFYDARNLYIGARMHEEDPARRVTSDLRRDSNNLYNNDHLAIVFDTFYDHRNGFGVSSNSEGGMFDWVVTNEQPNNNWNPVVDDPDRGFRGRMVGRDGRSVPVAAFQGGLHDLGLQRASHGAVAQRVVVPEPRPALVGPPRPVQDFLDRDDGRAANAVAQPQSRHQAVRTRFVGHEPLLDPPQENDGNFEWGVDAKWGVTQTLIADLTYNTDFAQVEDDEAQVNLTRFSLFFPERRDFFLEGQDIFAFGGVGGGGGGGAAAAGVAAAIPARLGTAEQHADPVLLAADRPRCRPDRPDRHRRPAPGAHRPVQHRRAQHADRRRADDRQGGHQFLRPAHDPRRPAPQPHRLHRHGAQPVGVQHLAKLQRRHRRAVSALRERQHQRLLRAHRHARTDRRSEQLPRPLRLERRPLRCTGRVPERRGRTSIRRSASCAAPRFAVHSVSCGSVRRPKQPSAIRKIYYEAILDYITGPGTKLETREAQGTYRLEFNSGDFASAEVTRSFEGLLQPFNVGGDVIVPVGNYSFTQTKVSYQFGPQRPVNGDLDVTYGGFFDGTLTALAWRGRVEMGAHYLVEPNISYNRGELPWGDFTTNLVAGRFTWTMTNRRFFSVLMQYQSASSSLTTNARFRWEYIPGSELFVVYSDGRDTLSTGYPG